MTDTERSNVEQNIALILKSEREARDANMELNMIIVSLVSAHYKKDIELFESAVAKAKTTSTLLGFLLDPVKYLTPPTE